MNAYIEIESLRSLIRHRNDDRYGECLRMLKRNLDIYFSFSKSEALSDPAIQSWIIGLTSGAIAKKPSWDCAYPDPENELTLDCINNIDQLCAVYLLDDEEPQRMSKAILVSCCGSELDTLSKLYVTAEDQEFEFETTAVSIGNWRNLGAYTTPCTDILISDRYILSRKSLLGKNLYSIINTLVQKTSNLSINIVIMVERNAIDANIDLENVSETIKDNVGDIVGVEPKVTFALCSKQPKKVLFHDRLILTNYRAITSGDSFNYFNEQGKVTTGGFGITISSLAKRCDYVQERVIETYCKQLQRELSSAVLHGDRKSNFLKFS